MYYSFTDKALTNHTNTLSPFLPVILLFIKGRHTLFQLASCYEVKIQHQLHTFFLFDFQLTKLNKKLLSTCKEFQQIHVQQNIQMIQYSIKSVCLFVPGPLV